MRTPEISMIVLAYEDAPSLPALVHELDAVLDALTERHEIVVVDDGSRDDTPAVIEGLHRQYGLASERHAENRGVGAAFATGVRAARYDHIGYIDGDGQLAADDLRPLAALLSWADAACGVRMTRADPLHRRAISGVYNAVLRTLFGLEGPDVNCGLKLFSRRFLEAVGPLESTGSFYDAELLIKGGAARLAIAGAPVRHLPRHHGIARGASRSSVLSAIETMTGPGMRPYWRSGLNARLLGSGLAVLSAFARRNPKEVVA